MIFGCFHPSSQPCPKGTQLLTMEMLFTSQTISLWGWKPFQYCYPWFTKHFLQLSDLFTVGRQCQLACPLDQFWHLDLWTPSKSCLIFHAYDILSYSIVNVLHLLSLKCRFKLPPPIFGKCFIITPLTLFTVFYLVQRWSMNLHPQSCRWYNTTTNCESR